MLNSSATWLWRCHKRQPLAADSPADDRARRLAADLLAQAREELNRADAKASILLAAVGIALGAVAGGLASRGWSPWRMAPVLAFVWWAGFAATGGGVAALLAAVYPRRHRRPMSAAAPGIRRAAYYGDLASYCSAAEVAAAVRQAAGQELELIADQILQVTRIADRKYRLLAWAIWLLAAGVVCDVTALLINSV